MRRTTSPGKRKLIKELKSKDIPDKEKEIIAGTLLGDGCLQLNNNRYPVLRFNHGIKQLEYLEMKVKLLPSLFVTDPMEFCAQSNFGSGFKAVSAFSIGHPYLATLEKIFYRGMRGIDRHRVLTKEFLSLLTKNSLLFWFLDDGSVDKSGSISLSTCAFSMKEHLLLQKWLKTRWGVLSEISKTSSGKKEYLLIRLNKDDSMKFRSIIERSEYFPLVPNDMGYKFPKIK